MDKRILCCPGCPLAPILGEGYPAHTTSTEHPVCLCTHWQGTGDFSQGKSRASHWGSSAGIGIAAPHPGGASSAYRGAESLTCARGLWCCQGLAGGSAVQGSIRKAWPFPGGEADPAWVSVQG